MIIVKRGTGNKKGGTIVSSALTDIPSQTYRGKTEINNNASRFTITAKPIQMNAIPLPYTYCNVTQVATSGVGRVVSVSIQQRHRSISGNIKIEVPR